MRRYCHICDTILSRMCNNIFPKDNFFFPRDISFSPQCTPTVLHDKRLPFLSHDSVVKYNLMRPNSRIELSDKCTIMGGSAFNICSCALRLPDFTKEDIRELYLLHTVATGQVFDESCFPLIWDATEGVPGLVNALAHELADVMPETQDRNVHITPEMVALAQEKIIHGIFSHDRDFIAKLNEESVRRVLQIIFVNHSNEEECLQITDEDIRLAENLGLVKLDKPLRISNGIYKEVMNLNFR